MTDLRLQREHEHTLSAAVRTWFGVKAGEANRRYREAVDARRREWNAEHDHLRDRRHILLAARPRTPEIIAEITAIETSMRDYRTGAVKPPDASDLEITRREEIAGYDAILTEALRSIRNRAMRGELDTRLVWSEAEQRFVVPEEELTK